jgi:very-short-patch-repair endonuclease
VNVAVAGYEVDTVWLGPRVVVELDGFEYHRTRAAFERDRARDMTFSSRGFGSCESRPNDFPVNPRPSGKQSER